MPSQIYFQNSYANGAAPLWSIQYPQPSIELAFTSGFVKNSLLHVSRGPAFLAFFPPPYLAPLANLTPPLHVKESKHCLRSRSTVPLPQTF